MPPASIRGVLSLAAAGVLGAACGPSGYQTWWDQDKNAIAPPPSGPAQGGTASSAHDGGASPADASTHAGDAGGAGPDDGSAAGPPPAPIRTVFYVAMAKQPWSAIEGSKSAPYVNGTLLARGAHAEAYYAAPDQQENSLPNVVWLEAGQDLGFTSNVQPTVDHAATTAHLVDQLENAGLDWRAYVDHVPTGVCPVADAYPYRTWHVPFIYFDDVSGNPPSPSAKRCRQHVFPFTQLATDLAADQVPAYAFIVPDMCNDMHDDCTGGSDPVAQGDAWLAANLPAILASKTYAAGGAVFVAWDYDPDGYGPVGFIALSANARAGLASTTKHTTSTTLRSLQEIFGLTPLLGDAANADDVAEMFTSFP